MNNLHRELAPISTPRGPTSRPRRAAPSSGTRRPPGGRRHRPVRRDAVRRRHRAPRRVGAAAPDGVRARRRRSPAAGRVPGAVHGHPAGRGRRRAGRQGLRLAAGQGRRQADRLRRGPAVFDGLPPAGSTASGPAARNPPLALPADPRGLPDRRRAGPERAAAGRRRRPVQPAAGRGRCTPRSPRPPTTATRSASTWSGCSARRRDHLGAGADGALLVSTRGGDYELHLGQDLSIGYLSHDADSIELYLEESLTFLVQHRRGRRQSGLTTAQEAARRGGGRRPRMLR